MKLQTQILIVACALLPLGAAHATSYSGAISIGNGLVVGGNWANATGGGLSWVVDDTSNSGMWTYTYTFNLPGFSPDISHAIVEVTDGATIGEFRVDGSAANEIRTWTPNDPGNPGIPGNMYGLKADTPANSSEPWTWSIITLRAPVWQDFYAKAGGQNNAAYAYNSGFLAVDPIDSPSNGSNAGHILGPNGSPGTNVPDGGATLTLMGLALSGLAAGRRFLKRA